MQKWKNWFIVLLGLWLVILGLLGLPSSVKNVLVIITGLTIAFVSFRKGANETINEKVS